MHLGYEGSKISENRPVATLAATAGGKVRANGLTMDVPVEVPKFSGTVENFQV